MEPIQDDRPKLASDLPNVPRQYVAVTDDIEETVRKDLRAAHTAAMRFFGEVATDETAKNYPPLAALDRLVAERDALIAERTWSKDEVEWAKLRGELKAAQFNVREWKDKAQDKITECEGLVAERDRLHQFVRHLVDDGPSFENYDDYVTEPIQDDQEEK
jgi:transcription initiation factor IIF auxiliary subunit